MWPCRHNGKLSRCAIVIGECRLRQARKLGGSYVRTNRQNPLERRRRIRLLSGRAESRRATRMPAIVLTSAVHGVDADIRAIADEFAANGVIAAAPDLFWRTLPGPLSARRRPRPAALAAAAREDQDRRARSRRHARLSAHAAAVQRPGRGDGFLLRRPLRDPRAEAARLRRRHFLPRQPDARLRRRARRRDRAGLHHLGRPRPPRRRPRCSTPIAPSRRA